MLADLQFSGKGRVAAGYGVQLKDISDYSDGAVQRGMNEGAQTIEGAAYGSSQYGYNCGVRKIGAGADGASQWGDNSGLQTIDVVAVGSLQMGVNDYPGGYQYIGEWTFGASQSGWNCGAMSIGPSSHGAEQRGFVAGQAGATNNGVGSIQLLNLTDGQSALITGNASIGLGASRVTDDQSIVAGDGLSSHGRGTVTAVGFVGDGSGLTNLDLSGIAGDNLYWDASTRRLNAVGTGGDGTNDTMLWSGTSVGLNPVQGRTALGLGSAATCSASAFAPADLSGYASDTVTYSNGHFHAVAAAVTASLSASDVTNAVLTAWPNLDTNCTNKLTTAGGTLSGDLNMNSNRVTNLPTPRNGGDAVSKDYLQSYMRAVLSSVPPQGNLSMGVFTNGAPAAFPLTFN
jgi:hypothetical protein